MADSYTNGNRHLHYKQFFDKRNGAKQHLDPLKYSFKTPSSGYLDYTEFDQNGKYYWDRRMPVKPESMKRYVHE